jgi:hypothetical protein
MHPPIDHYTTGDRFLRIIAKRAILPATADVTPPEIPAVWLSCQLANRPGLEVLRQAEGPDSETSRQRLA